MTKLVLDFKKIKNDKTKYDALYSHTKAETTINEGDIDNIFKSIYTKITSNINKSLGKGSGQIIDLVIVHNIIISKYNSLAGSSYTKLSKEFGHPRKGSINIKNIDNNEWFSVEFSQPLDPADHHLGRITKADKHFVKKT